MSDSGVFLTQTQQQDAGLPGTNVFTALKTPPTTGVAAQTSVVNRSKATGSSVAASQDVLGLRYQNRDFYRDAQDTASIKHS